MIVTYEEEFEFVSEYKNAFQEIDSKKEISNNLSIEELGRTKEETESCAVVLRLFKEDWEIPEMDVYDKL